MARLRWISLWLLVLLVPARADPMAVDHTVHARIDQDIATYDVHPDMTFVMTDVIDVTLLTQRGIQMADRSVWTFYPDKQSVELLEAWVDQPDGTRVTVPATGVFTRPSAATQSAPGFVNSMTTTVLFPQLREGSRTHVVWRVTQTRPGLFGFNVRNQAAFQWDTVDDEARINIPADVPLHWRTRGYGVTDQTQDGVRHIVASVHDLVGHEVESRMVATEDFQPTFEATTLPNMEAIGAIIYRESRDRATVTPEIAALAERIVGPLTGRDAARAIYDWVASNIRYIAVYLSLDDGMVSHTATEVLHNGYGDCKDYVVLMQALLAARDIVGIPVSIDWGARYNDPISWAPYFTNHRIIYLPAFHQFANPTDRFAPFDALDRRLAGKLVVLSTPTGEVMRTPESTPDAHRYRMQSHLTLAADGAIDGTATYAMSPNTEEYARALVSGASSMADLAERLLQRTIEGGFGTMRSSDPRDLSTPFVLSATWHSVHVVNNQGDRVYLRVPAGPDLLPPGFEREKISPTGIRHYAELADAREHEWQTTITLPPGLHVVQLPDDVTVNTSVGHYASHYARNGDDVTVSRDLVVLHDVVDATIYPDLERLLYTALVDARGILVLSRDE